MVSLPEGPDLEALLAGFKAVTSGFASVPVALPGTPYARARKARDAIFAILRRVVAEHRASPQDDGLGRVLASKGADGAAIADEDAVRELHHVFIAGYIVFAELGALLERLDARPDLRAELEAEVRAGAPSGPITVRALASMPLLDRVVQETKRITPVVPIAFGRAKKTFELEGYRIPEGTMLYWAPWSHDQDPGTFPDPGAYDPERFSDERAEHLRHENAFAPQGMGKPLGHACPGIDYATLFMQVFAIVVLRDWTWSFPDQDMTLDFGHLPPEHADGLRVVVTRGRAAASRAAPSAAGRAKPPAVESPMPVLGSEALTALAGVMWADGRIADEEVAALVRIARASGLGADETAAVEAAARKGDAAASGPLHLEAEAAEHLYSLACLMAASDGTVDPRERDAVAALGERLGLDERARSRASAASHAVAEALGVSDHALAALAAEMERG